MTLVASALASAAAQDIEERLRQQPFIKWDWIPAHWGDIRMRLVEHIQLTFIAVGIGLALAMLLAMVVLRWRRAYAPLIGVTGILYTIPSIALFALLMPWTGLSLLTAEIALVSYTLLILLRNIVTGIDQVPRT